MKKRPMRNSLLLVALLLVALPAQAQLNCSGGPLNCPGAPTGTGVAVLQTSPTITTGLALNGTLTQTSNSATAFESGPNGSTNPVLRIINNVASAATGLSIAGA